MQLLVHLTFGFLRGMVMFWVLIFLVVVYLTLFHLRGEDLGRYDWPRGQSFATGEGPNEEHRGVLKLLREGLGSVRRGGGQGGGRIARMRAYMDSMADNQDIDAQITPVVAAGVPAEWVLAPGADPARRLLYIHGGGFYVGSPKSHRNITSTFSKLANAAVLAIDYRLMPEHSRRAGIDDCRKAYTWLANNGPEGLGAADRMFIAGDSAGGNLTLSLIAWLRGRPIRQPDAAIALSPLTDSTLVSPSMTANMESDAMLGPVFGKLLRVPRPLLWWGSWLLSRINPSDPIVSPVLGDLSNLPPTLVHASEAEMLLDDARRYVNKACAAGSTAQIQTWAHMVHVWHIFTPQLPEARAAWGEIETFIADVDNELSAKR